jgi:hypothetical protein
VAARRRVLLFLGPILYFCIFGPGMDLARGFLARSASRNTEAMGLSMVWFSAALPLSIMAIFVHLAAGLTGGSAGAARPHG